MLDKSNSTEKKREMLVSSTLHPLPVMQTKLRLVWTASVYCSLELRIISRKVTAELELERRQKGGKEEVFDFILNF